MSPPLGCVAAIPKGRAGLGMLSQPPPAPLGCFIPKFPMQSQCLLMPSTAARHGWDFVPEENLQLINSVLILLQQGIIQQRGEAMAVEHLKRRSTKPEGSCGCNKGQGWVSALPELTPWESWSEDPHSLFPAAQTC